MIPVQNSQPSIPPFKRAHWPQWAGLLTVLWSFLYGMLGLYWAFGGSGFPFSAESDPATQESLFAGAQAASGGWIIATLGVAGALIALAMSRMKQPGSLRLLLLVPAGLFAAALLVVIPDRRVLMAVAYAPVFLIGAPFHWPPVSFLKALPWPVINQFILMVGGGLWAATALFYQRRSRGACIHCGRTAATIGQGSLKAGAWTKWSVGIAVLVPVLYASTRLLWALGIPVGISGQFLHEGQASGLWLAGAALACVALGGALLTLGLVQPWGEIFPRWMIGLAGKRVPPPLAIIPASCISLVITSAGLAYVRYFLRAPSMESWTTVGPELLWPLWGLSLAAATLAYYQRRRGKCRYCGRGEQ